MTTTTQLSDDRIRSIIAHASLPLGTRLATDDDPRTRCWPHLLVADNGDAVSVSITDRTADDRCKRLGIRAQ